MRVERHELLINVVIMVLFVIIGMFKLISRFNYGTISVEVLYEAASFRTDKTAVIFWLFIRRGNSCVAEREIILSKIYSRELV
jgi:hypothetical protein